MTSTGAVIRKSAIVVLVISVVILTFLSILSIWDLVGDSVFWKSVTTIGVIAFASLVVIIASNAWDNHNQGNTKNSVPPVNPPMNPPRPF